MRVQSLHAGVTAAQVRDATGFDLVMPTDLPRSEPPSEEELRILRELVDSTGVLRRAVA
jgi:hypothetical protein